jgi:transcriptional regulator with XRE-family HTH domain
MKTPKQHKAKKKYPWTSTACHYVMAQKKLSARAIARVLGIHHSTWQGYLKGQHQPKAAIQRKISAMMQVKSFETLVAAAVHYYRGMI